MWDNKHVMYDNADCYANATDHDAGDKLNLKAAKADIGQGRPVRWRCVLTAAVTGGTSIQAVLCDSDDDSTYVKKVFGPVVLVASALAGKVLYDGPLPDGLGQYVKTVFVNAGNNAAGKATSRLNP
jgi:hypothetical protein